MLHGLEYIGIGVTPYDVVNAIATAWAETNVDSVGCAKKIVQITHHLLIGAAEKQPDQIRVVVLEVVEL